MTELHAALHICITTSGSCGSGSSELLTALVSVTVGAVLGALLGFFGSYLLGRQQRDWQRDRAKFERELSIVRSLDEALVETELRIMNKGVPEGGDRWEPAHGEWEQAWVRVSPFLANAELKDRYQAVGTILTDLVMYDGKARMAHQRNVALRATLNARQGIAYFGREEDLPSPCFPSPEDLTRLLGEGDPDPLLPDAPLRKWLKEHPVPPWHPERAL